MQVICSRCVRPKTSQDLIVQSSCCAQLYCWNCVAGSRFPCTLCSQMLDANKFRLFDSGKVDTLREPKRSSCPQNCGARIAVSELSDHFRNDCPNWNIECPQCGRMAARQELPHHMEALCTNKMIHCEYVNVGCTAKVPASEMARHMKEAAPDHLSLMMTNVRSQAEDLRGLREEVTNSSRRSSVQLSGNYPAPSAPPAEPARNEQDLMPGTGIYPLISNMLPPQQQEVVLANAGNIFNFAGAHVQNMFNIFSSMVSPRARASIQSTASSAIRTYNTNAIPGPWKIAILLILFYMFKGLLMFFFRCGVLGLVSTATYDYLTKTRHWANPSTKPYVFGFYGFLLIYLATSIL